MSCNIIRDLIRWWMLALFLASPTLAQTIVVKDRHGIPVVEINSIELLPLGWNQDHTYERQHAQVIGTIKNISNADLILCSGALNATVPHVNGPDTALSFDTINALGDSAGICELPKDTSAGIHYTFQFKEPPGFTQEELNTVLISFSNTWQSPEDLRLTALTEAAHRRQQLAEQLKREAQYATDQAKEKAKATEEQRRVRTACLTIFQNTADKKIGDLTVREEQQVRACQALGLYPPR